jgi:hypothetical protein
MMGETALLDGPRVVDRTELVQEASVPRGDDLHSAELLSAGLPPPRHYACVGKTKPPEDPEQHVAARWKPVESVHPGHHHVRRLGGQREHSIG